MDRLLISADSHVTEPMDLWTDSLPEHLRADGPRIDVVDGATCLMVGGTVLRRFKPPKSATPTDTGALVKAAEDERRASMVSKGASDPGVRLKDMDTDGVWGEVMFPNLGFMFAYRIANPELQVAVCRIYNDWLADTYIGESDRFCPVPMLPILDVDTCVAELRRFADRGFRAAMVPVHTDARPYNDAAYDPLWATAAELGMPLCFHAGTGRTMTPAHGPGGAVVNYVLTVGAGPMEAASYLCGSGVLMRHPDFRVVLVECGSGWLAWALHAMDDAYREHHQFVNPELDLLPSEYFRRQGFVTFQHDPVGFHNVALTGDDCLMWGSDYPHSEGTWPESRQYLERQLDGVSAATADKVLFDNAARLYRFKVPSTVGS